MEDRWMSKKQIETLKLIDQLEEFEKGRTFTQAELPGVTLHTMKSLTEKGYIGIVEGPFGDSGPVYYYKKV